MRLGPQTLNSKSSVNHVQMLDDAIALTSTPAKHLDDVESHSAAH